MKRNSFVYLSLQSLYAAIHIIYLVSTRTAKQRSAKHAVLKVLAHSAIPWCECCLCSKEILCLENILQITNYIKSVLWGYWVSLQTVKPVYLWSLSLSRCPVPKVTFYRYNIMVTWLEFICISGCKGSSVSHQNGLWKYALNDFSRVCMLLIFVIDRVPNRETVYLPLSR